jgi:hypothetical protein
VDDTLRPPPHKIVTERCATSSSTCCYTAKGNDMDSKQFAELHAKCWETLKHYVHEADRMCELFGQCLPEPSAIQIRSDIVEQRVRENNAYTWLQAPFRRPPAVRIHAGEPRKSTFPFRCWPATPVQRSNSSRISGHLPGCRPTTQKHVLSTANQRHLFLRDNLQVRLRTIDGGFHAALALFLPSLSVHTHHDEP